MNVTLCKHCGALNMQLAHQCHHCKKSLAELNSGYATNSSGQISTDRLSNTATSK